MNPCDARVDVVFCTGMLDYLPLATSPTTVGAMTFAPGALLVSATSWEHQQTLQMHVTAGTLYGSCSVIYACLPDALRTSCHLLEPGCLHYFGVNICWCMQPLWSSLTQWIMVIFQRRYGMNHTYRHNCLTEGLRVVVGALGIYSYLHRLLKIFLMSANCSK